MKAIWVVLYTWCNGDYTIQAVCETKADAELLMRQRRWDPEDTRPRDYPYEGYRLHEWPIEKPEPLKPEQADAYWVSVGVSDLKLFRRGREIRNRSEFDSQGLIVESCGADSVLIEARSLVSYEHAEAAARRAIEAHVAQESKTNQDAQLQQRLEEVFGITPSAELPSTPTRATVVRADRERIGNNLIRVPRF